MCTPVSSALCFVKSAPSNIVRSTSKKLSRYNILHLHQLQQQHNSLHTTAIKGCCDGALLSRCTHKTSKCFIIATSQGSTDLRLRASMTTGIPPAAPVESYGTPATLSKQQARDLAVRLTPEERDVLISALQETQSQKVKAEYEGQLAAFRWRSKFGRPSRVPSLGDVDPTGTYCAVPEDWLLRKYVPQPTRHDLFRVSLTNAIPFVGFGFLDNFFMIIAGDQIETSLGAVIALSTMAAAAFGNTISDILGIGSAFYVERLVQKIGFKAPKLTPIQLDLPKSRRAANLGRVLGVTIGCLLGMTPLLILHKGGKDKEGQGAEEPVKTSD
ncbi:uncharacterized protein LOC105690120 isoform X2 [Athalia rosae]|uniref:uncharacterized protein LOC105690120 isoform X2 n=1 Tax=Athalia rosae TaxID=37344 RepID=UPI0020338AEF|nr:uncharacterized protein LOC105690120 isoform X2 [Athalia rosae]